MFIELYIAKNYYQSLLIFPTDFFSSLWFFLSLGICLLGTTIYIYLLYIQKLNSDPLQKKNNKNIKLINGINPFFYKNLVLSTELEISSVVFSSEDGFNDFIFIEQDRNGKNWIFLNTIKTDPLTISILVSLLQTLFQNTLRQSIKASPSIIIEKVNNSLLKNNTLKKLKYYSITSVLLKYEGNGRFHVTGQAGCILIYHNSSGDFESPLTSTINFEKKKIHVFEVEEYPFMLDSGDILVLTSPFAREVTHNAIIYDMTELIKKIIQENRNNELSIIEEKITEEYLTITENKPENDITLFLIRKQHTNKYTSSSLSATIAVRTFAKLGQLMEEEKLYEDPRLNLSIVSEKLNIPPAYLSQILTTKLGKHFNDYVNEYRISAVKIALQSGELTHKSILGIALDAGFNSKSAFYRIFKENSGVTPYEFSKSHKGNDH